MNTPRNKTQGLVEVLLLKQVEQNPVCWEALVRPGRKMSKGEHIHFPEDVGGRILEKGKYGFRIVQFSLSDDEFTIWLKRVGRMPLPPYIKISDETTAYERYQTVFARKSGSVAAPTAGLHFTPDLLAEIDQADVCRVELTLHVGLGTFQPVRTERVEEHSMYAEPYQLSPTAARQLKDQEGRRVAVGTTAVRVLEHVICTSPSGKIEAGRGDTDLFIFPGFKFRAIDALLTNFHLPRSTLLMLVCAFAGQELTLSAYRHAVNKNYRFYSYGDCMLII